MRFGGEVTRRGVLGPGSQAGFTFSESGRTWFSLRVNWGEGPGSRSGEKGE